MKYSPVDICHTEDGGHAAALCPCQVVELLLKQVLREGDEAARVGPAAQAQAYPERPHLSVNIFSCFM